MRVWHAEPVYDHTNSLRLENFPHTSTNRLCSDNDLLSCRIVNVGKVIDMEFGDHQALPRAGRMEDHYCHYRLILEDRACWLPTSNNLAEYTRWMLFAHGVDAGGLTTEVKKDEHPNLQ